MKKRIKILLFIVLVFTIFFIMGGCHLINEINSGLPWDRL
jgi:hypothetical protein